MGIRSRTHLPRLRSHDLHITNITEQIQALHDDLSGSSFTDVNLTGSSFSNVSLTNVTFEDACFNGVSIHKRLPSA